MRGDEKITLNEIKQFMNGISGTSAEKVTKRDLRIYLEAFPVKDQKPGDQVKVKKSDINFLLNGKQEMTAQELHELLANTMIEEFDPVQEAFDLLDVNGTKELNVDTFRNIFEKLELGKIEQNEEKIFLEVATKDGLDKITIDDFRRILSYNADGDEDENQEEIGMDQEQPMDGQGENEDDIEGDDYGSEEQM